MSSLDKTFREPLQPSQAKAQLVHVLDHGTVFFSDHARTEMQKDNIGQAEALLVLRGGVVEPAEFDRGSWRYRVRVGLTYVVVAFRTDDQAVVVTAWRRRL